MRRKQCYVTAVATTAALCLLQHVLAMPSMRSFFKQSINLPGILSVRTVLQRPSLLLPTIHLQSLNELNLTQLQSMGVKYIVFDKDNTLRYGLQYWLAL